MDKRYQVFISSTFLDLREERQAVLRAVLEIDHMPAGMELFPASDDTAWQLIKDVVDASDYYLLIIGGRYGSVDDGGLGYTEREYEYAREVRKPVLALLHQKPDSLPRERTETDEGAWAKLLAFRARVEKHHTCVYWSTAEDLKAKVIVGVINQIRRHPATGWVRADRIPSDATIAEVLTLRQKIDDLEKELSDISGPPKGVQDLAQDLDTLLVEFAVQTRQPDGFEVDIVQTSIQPTWTEIFAACGPAMLNEGRTVQVKRALFEHFEAVARGKLSTDKKFEGLKLGRFEFDETVVDTIVIQLRALGLIEHSVRPRSVHDTHSYWRLTKYGDRVLTHLRAMRRRATLWSMDLNRVAQFDSGDPAKDSVDHESK